MIKSELVQRIADRNPHLYLRDIEKIVNAILDEITNALARGDRVELRVVDRGPGIPENDRERMFFSFQRLGDTDNTTGVGLGLALARGLAEAMGGTLTAEDTPGGGLTMTVSLPAAPDA